MTPPDKPNPASAAARTGSGDTCLLDGEQFPDRSPSRSKTQDKFCNPRAVREAKRQLTLEFLHECAGGIQIHAALVQTFAEIGAAGVCYAMRRLLAHINAAHPVLVELRDESREAAP